MEVTRSVEDDVDELELLTRPGREEDLRTFLLLLHPADVAELVNDVSEETALAILRHLEPERASELMSELESSVRERLLRQIRPQELAPIVGSMDTDDITDFLQGLDETTARELLATLPADDRKEVTQLLRYDPSSAGGIMQTELVSVPLGTSVAAAIEAVRRRARDFDILSVFVVDDEERYIGNISLQDLVLAPPDTRVDEILTAKAVEVTPEVDQEEVARLFDRYSLVELGVVDQRGRLIGRITADDIHEVLIEEHEEDLLKMSGTAAQPEVINSGEVLRIARLRLPWLVSTFFAGMTATYILQQARVVFGTMVVLLTFVPVITGMSGNVGSQSAMIMIRGMALGHVDPTQVGRNILKDVAIGCVMATICGILVAMIVATWQANVLLGLCVGTALAISMVTASALGSAEPPILKRLGIDPAIAAGPLITSINDVTGVLIYTWVSLLFIDHLR